MILLFFRTALVLLACCSSTVSWAITPNGTYFFGVAKNGAEIDVSIHQYFESARTTLSQGKITIPGKSLKRALMLDAPAESEVSDRRAAVLQNDADQVFLYDNPADEDPVAQERVRFKGATAICQHGDSDALFALADNELVSLSSGGSEIPIASKGWLGSDKGQIVAMQMVSPDRLVVVTSKDLLFLVNLKGPKRGHPVLLREFSVAATLFKKLFRPEGISAIVASQSAVWVAHRAGTFWSLNYVHAGLFEISTGNLLGEVEVPNSTQMLSMDSANDDLLVRANDAYIAADKTGSRKIKSGHFFKIGGIASQVLLASPYELALVDHPIPALNWMARHKTAFVDSTQSRALAEDQPAFFLFMMYRQNLKVGEETTVERFAEAINCTDSLKYYFKDLNPFELDQLGFRLQVGWLLPIKGREGNMRTRLEIAELLARAGARKINAQKICEKKLLNP